MCRYKYTGNLISFYNFTINSFLSIVHIKKKTIRREKIRHFEIKNEYLEDYLIYIFGTMAQHMPFIIYDFA